MFGENAQLLDIRGPGTGVDAYGDPSANGSVAWSGSVPCTLTRTRSLNPNAVASARIGGAGRSDIQTMVEEDRLIVRTATGIDLSMVPGGRQTGWTVLVEDRRTPARAQHRFTVRSVDIRAGATPGQSIAITLGDGV